MRQHPLPLSLLVVTLLAGCGGSGGGGPRQGVAGLSSAAVPASAIEITSPADGSNVPAGRTTVRGRIAGDALAVRVEGQTATVTTSGEFEAAVDLAPGLHGLRVEAERPDGTRDTRLLSLLAGDVRPEGEPLAGAGEVRATGASAAARVRAVGAPAAASSGPPAGFPPMRFIAANPGNFIDRSGPRPIRYIVIHTIEGSEAGCISWMQNPVSNVSAHYVLSRTGRVTQMVQDEDIAYHVGTSNRQSIGIENEGYAGRNLWTDVQYETLARLVRALADKHGVPRDRQHIVGHVELPNQTHTDPGPHFDWRRFMALVNGASGPAPQPARKTRTLVSPLGAEVELALGLAPGAGDANGTSVVLSAAAQAKQAALGPFAGSLVTGGDRTGMGGRSSPDWDAALGVHQDAISATLLAAWRAGALETGPIDRTTVGALAPTRGGDLEAAALVAREPALASILEPGELLELRLRVDLPPVATVVPGQPDPLSLGLAALRLEVDAFHPLKNARRSLGRIDLALRSACAVEVAGDDAALRPTGPLEVRAAAEPAPGIDAGALAQLGEALAPLVLETAAGALRGVAIPLPEGLALRQTGVEAEGKTLFIRGR